MRAFVALELPEPVRSACADQLHRLRSAAGRLRLTPAEQLHVTLAFLADIDEARAAAVAATLPPVARAHPGFTLAVRGCGAFPRLAHARVLWFGVDDPAGECATLHAAVWDALAPLGFARESRPFRPHVTFARLRTGRLSPELRAALDAAATGFDGGAGPVARLVLMESVLAPAGAQHRKLAEFPLG